MIGHGSLVPRPITSIWWHAIKFCGSNWSHLNTQVIHHSTYKWLFGIISYVLDHGFSRLKPKLSIIFTTFLWSSSNTCLVNIEIYFYFGCHAIYPSKICYDWWRILLSRIWLVITFSVVRTTEFYCIPPNPCLRSWYKTKGMVSFTVPQE